MRRALALAAALLALAPGLAPAPAPAPRVIDLARASWTRNGQPPTQAPVVRAGADGAPAVVELPCDATGVRWACEFTTPDAATHRLQLLWRGAPEGLLHEVVLDGQTLSPPRDGWRPTPRDLRADLGGVWLGRGTHLLELVAREVPPDGVGLLRPSGLALGEP